MLIFNRNHTNIRGNSDVDLVIESSNVATLISARWMKQRYYQEGIIIARGEVLQALNHVMEPIR